MLVLLDPVRDEFLGTITLQPYEVRLTAAGRRRDVGRHFEALDEVLVLDPGDPPDDADPAAEREVPITDRPDLLRERVGTIARRHDLALVPAEETAEDFDPTIDDTSASVGEGDDGGGDDIDADDG